MMVIDGERRIVAINPALRRWLGDAAAEHAIGQQQCGALLGCQDAEGCSLVDSGECPGLLAMRQMRYIPSVEYTIHVAEGRRVPVSASYTPIHGLPNGPLWTLVILRDMSMQKERERRLAWRAAKDPLTGVANRERLVEFCERELKQAERHHRPLSIAMADVDGLKARNDAHGHQAGDELLQLVAQLLQTGHRGTELVARYGGDEFTIVMPETDAAQAAVVAERLRRIIAEFPSAHPSSVATKGMTVSVGVATFPDDGPTLDALIAQADRCLYHAKHRGGNRVMGASRGSRKIPQTDRRRERRLALHTPVYVRGLGEPPHGELHKGQVKNLSLQGVYLTVPQWKSIAPDDMLLLSIPIPPEHRDAFPRPRLAGCGRVVRVDELKSEGDNRLGLAIEFAEI